MSNIASRLILFPFLILVITVHEFAHALAAYLLGDQTAKLSGRLTLNPLSHLDPIGSLMMIVAGFGWGKPVPFNPLNLRKPIRDSAIIAFSGPASNFLLATVLSIVFHFFPSSQLLLLISLNLGLGFFNLLPIHPLDGFKVVTGILPRDLAISFSETSRYGMIFLLILLFSGIFNAIFFPLINAFLRLLTGV